MRLIVSFVGRKKTHFLDLRIKSYGCLKFQGEVWAGRACAAANEKELTTCTKSGGQEEKKFNKNGNSLTGPGVDPQPAGPGPLSCGWQLLVARLSATNGRDLVARPRSGPDC
jgi:hypothetical protein